MADEPVKRTRRQVKNPETFRERAIKASEVSDKPKRKAYVGSFLRRVLTIIAWPFAKIGKFLVKFRLFRWLGKILAPSFIRSSWQELKQVTWPNWKQSRDLTLAVIIFAVVFGVLVAIVDYGLDKLFRNVLLK